MKRGSPAFGWPPGFVNTATGGFLFLDSAGNVLVQPPIVTGVVRNGPGDYTITTKYGIGLAWTQNGSGSPRLTSINPTDLVDYKEWQLDIWDETGARADAYMGIWLSYAPLAWAVTP